jgi:hypothetical protein
VLGIAQAGGDPERRDFGDLFQVISIPMLDTSCPCLPNSRFFSIYSVFQRIGRKTASNPFLPNS